MTLGIQQNFPIQKSFKIDRLCLATLYYIQRDVNTIHDAGKHVIEFRNNNKCQVLQIQDIQDILSWACIYREYTLTIETRKDEVLGLSFHTEKPLLMCFTFYSL